MHGGAHVVPEHEAEVAFLSPCDCDSIKRPGRSAGVAFNFLVVPWQVLQPSQSAGRAWFDVGTGCVVAGSTKKKRYCEGHTVLSTCK